MASLSGCIGTTPAESGSPQDTGGSGLPTGTVDQTQVPIPTEGVPGTDTGSVIGQVLNTDGIPVEQANVILVNTPNYTKTASSGRFAFHAVNEGDYTLRVDANKYVALESEVNVAAGHITELVVHLEPTEAVLGYRPHFHNLWEGKPTKILLDADLRFPWGPATGGAASPANGCVNETGLKSPSFAGWAADDDAVGDTGPVTACYALYVNLEKTVPPGAAHMNVTVSWTENAIVKPNVRLDMLNATAPSPTPPIPQFRELNWGPIFANGDTKTFPLSADAADSGHANFTQWVMRLFIETKVQGKPVQSGDLIRQFLDPFHVKVEVVRGVIPPDKPHPHFWVNGSRLRLVDAEVETTFQEKGIAFHVVRDPTMRIREEDGDQSSVPYLLLPRDRIVPPGTTRLNVWLNYTHSDAKFDAIATQKTLVFRTAAMNPATATFASLKQVSGQETPGHAFYSFPVTDEEADKFYQTRSLWLFLLTNAGQKTNDRFINECGSPVPAACQATYKLTVEAVNENWADDFLAGRI